MLQTQFKPAYILSAIIAILASVASAGGLFTNLYRDNPLGMLLDWATLPMLIMAVLYYRLVHKEEADMEQSVKSRAVLQRCCALNPYPVE